MRLLHAPAKHQPRRSRGRRRWWRRTLRFGSLTIFAVAVLGLYWLGRPQHEHFVQRRTPIAKAEILQNSTMDDGTRQTLVALEAESGLRVRFRVLRHEQERPQPAVVLLAGHRTGSKAVELVGDPGRIAVAALDYPYHGPEKFRGVWHGLSHLGEVRRALLDTPPAVSVVLDWLLRQPWIDPERVELVGASLGTPFASVAGALDQRFRRVWLLHGGVDNRAWLEAALRPRIDTPLLRAMAASSLHHFAHGASFDTAEWVARIAPRPVVVIGAEADEGLTRANIEGLYAAAGQPRELLWTTGGHVTRNRPHIVQELLGLVRERIEADAPATVPSLR